MTHFTPQQTACRLSTGLILIHVHRLLREVSKSPSSCRDCVASSCEVGVGVKCHWTCDYRIRAFLILLVNNFLFFCSFSSTKIKYPLARAAAKLYCQSTCLRVCVSATLILNISETKTPVTLRRWLWRPHCVLQFSMNATGTWSKWKNVQFSSSYYVLTTSQSGSHSV